MYKIEINIGEQRIIKFAKNMNELTKSLKNIKAESINVTTIDETTYKIETLIQNKTREQLLNIRSQFVNAYMIQKDEYQVRALQRIDERLKENDEQ